MGNKSVKSIGQNIQLQEKRNALKSFLDSTHNITFEGKFTLYDLWPIQVENNNEYFEHISKKRNEKIMNKFEHKDFDELYAIFTCNIPEDKTLSYEDLVALNQDEHCLDIWVIGDYDEIISIRPNESIYDVDREKERLKFRYPIKRIDIRYAFAKFCKS